MTAKLLILLTPYFVTLSKHILKKNKNEIFDASDKEQEPMNTIKCKKHSNLFKLRK